jgi:hypothetical protein
MSGLRQTLLVAMLFGTATQSSAQSDMGRWTEHRVFKEKLDEQDKKNNGNSSQLGPKQQVVNDFAACVWQQEPDKARTALATAIDTQDERDALIAVAQYEACSDVAFISGRSGEFRGALAETGIHADQDRSARLRALAPVPAARVAIAKGRAFVASYSSCIASADPLGSLALLGTPLGSPQETAAIQAMATSLRGCMPESAQYRVDVRDVRNHVADALYRMSELPNA